jgi:hypothetical protein
MMTVSKGAVLLGSALASCLIVPSLARAGSGTAELLLSGVRSLTVVDMGDMNVTAGGASGTLTIVRGSAEPFSGNVSGAVQCVIFAKKSSGGFDLEADCAASFSPEDKLFLVFKRKTGDLAAGTAAEGIEQIAGGTGKFAGVSGECRYVVENFPANWSVTTSKCQWQR